MPGMHFVERERCPVCGGTDHLERANLAFDTPPMRAYLDAFYPPSGSVEFDYLEGARYILRDCRSCGLIYQVFVPDDALMTRLYERWIDAAYHLRMQAILDDIDVYSMHAQEVMQIVGWLRGGKGGMKTLDFGMGWAKWSMMAQAFGCDVWGAELSQTRIEFAQSKGIRVMAWEDRSAHTFDFVNTEQVFEHLADPVEMLRELRALLAPGGVVKISVPGAHGIESALAKMDWTAPRHSSDSLMPVAPLEHLNCFRRETLMRLAAQAGMVEVAMPLKIQYAYLTNWSSATKAVKNLVRPIYRDVLRRQNYVFLRADPNAR